VRTVVLASGRGSNLRALVEAAVDGPGGASIVGVVSDRPGCEALVFAEERGIATRAVPLRAYASRELWDAALAQAVRELDPQLVVLAGFMKIVGPPLLEAYPGRIINIHPSLLPAFAGKDGPADALAAGVRITGCTVHVVDTGLDSGPILAQAAVVVLPDDDRASLHARIQRVEHRLLPSVVAWIATGAIELSPLHIRVECDARVPALVCPPIALK